jgi:transcriptional regulator with XRE-family HTH domain
MLCVDRIERLVSESKLSINEIAELAEITPSAVWKLRHGKMPNVSAEVLARFAAVFGVSVDFLMGIDRDDHGVPVPAPEIMGIVARLNQLPADLRKAAGQLIEALLDFGAAQNVQPHGERTERWMWYLDRLTDEQYEQYVREFETRAAQADAAESQAQSPAPQAANAQSGG